MENKRSPYVKVILVLAGILIISNLFYLLTNLANISAVFNSPLPFSTIGDFVFTILIIVISSIYFFKLYSYGKNLLMWTDISFIFLGLQLILTRVFYVVETEAKISFSSLFSQGATSEASFISHAVSLQVFTGIGIILVIGIFWYTFRKHLKERVLEGNKEIKRKLKK